MPRHFKNQFDLCTTACVRSKTKRHVFCRPYRGRHVSFSLYKCIDYKAFRYWFIREMLGCSPDQLVQLLTRKLNAPTAV